MYFEEAEVKQYFRKDSKGVKKPYYQINIKKKSKFNEVKTVALTDIAELKELLKNYNEVNINELSNKLDEKEKEIRQLKQELKQLKEDNSKVTSDNYELQQEVIKAKESYEKTLKEVASEKDTSKKLVLSIAKLNSEKAELEKENIFLLNRNIFNRIINKKYEAILNKLPEADI